MTSQSHHHPAGTTGPGAHPALAGAERARVRAAMRELLLHLARTLPAQDRRSRPGGRGVRRPDTEL
ncbi:hypothetical protein GJ689_18290 [Rhodoplanes serenus]|jgi:hypothetical protein|uniref:Uncharacterized protein n=1 Tax=Rhodoplanes serenus TaxID=200615 RepID=A0A327K2R1_9BRAD|nr:hypothetical protein [Rhodoplanes serenus]MTW18152.1 hypothetical protein [Rhodoplanes serenus]RAI32561.1 hypothetical protein CH340_15055 [Rhodoplanes serenus]VCU08513.1 hypothetical protein RHODGE_RHODGE_01682 [Rhodoplanes serenus]